MTETITIDYAELPGFPVSGVAGHAGQLVAGKLEGVPVLCMKGRGHFYEGRGMQVMTTAVRTSNWGCGSCWRPTPPVHCAARWRRGWWPLPITSTSCRNRRWSAPTTSASGALLQLANAYDRDLRPAGGGGRKRGHPRWRKGIRAAYTGPNFETPAEIRMMQTPGCDVVGMSIVPEVLTAPLRPQGAGGVRDDQLRRRAVGYAALP